MAVGNTKYAAARLFNALKSVYRKDKIYTVEEMLEKLNACDHATVHPTTEQDFFDWDHYLSQFYRPYTGMVKQGLIFLVHSDDLKNNQFIAKIRKKATLKSILQHISMQSKRISKGFV